MLPPATNTWPFCRSVDPCEKRVDVMLPVGLHSPVDGLYSSAEARQGACGLLLPSPPTTSTSPLASSVAVCDLRAVDMLPITVHVPVVGLYNSALARAAPEGSWPPATSTLPLGSSVAVCAARAVFKLPVVAQVPELPAKTGTARLTSREKTNRTARHGFLGNRVDCVKTVRIRAVLAVLPSETTTPVKPRRAIFVAASSSWAGDPVCHRVVKKL